MIGLPTSAPRAYGNQHNLSTPKVANNRSGMKVGISKKPPNLMQGPVEQHRQIGFAPGGGNPPEQQPMYAPMPFPNPNFLQMQQPILPRQMLGSEINFGKQYYEQAMPLG